MPKETKIILVGLVLLLGFVVVFTITTSNTEADWKPPGWETCYFCLDGDKWNCDPGDSAYVRCECFVGSWGCPDDMESGCKDCVNLNCGQCGDPGSQ